MQACDSDDSDAGITKDEWMSHFLVEDEVSTEECQGGEAKAAKELKADCFWIAPSTTSSTYGPINAARRETEEIEHRTSQSLLQAAVFNSCCRIFAPRYRQVTN